VTALKGFTVEELVEYKICSEMVAKRVLSQLKNGNVENNKQLVVGVQEVILRHEIASSQKECEFQVKLSEMKIVQEQMKYECELKIMQEQMKHMQSLFQQSSLLSEAKLATEMANFKLQVVEDKIANQKVVEPVIIREFVPLTYDTNWDLTSCGTNILVNGDTITKNIGVYGWNANIRGSRPGYFKLKLLKRGPNGYVMIGLAPNTTNKNGLNYATCGWYYYVNSGGLYSQEGTNNKAYCEPMNEGSIIEVVYANNAIEFIIDNVRKGYAHINLPSNLTLYPSIDICGVGISVQLMA